MMKTLADIGEQGMIARLKALIPGFSEGVGIGDDTAIVSGDQGFDYLYTTDPVTEGRHFLSSDDPERIGHKAVGRVLSDFAAMGGAPLYLLVNVVAPNTLPVERLEKVYQGMTALLDSYGAPIIGGDLSEGTEFSIHVFGVGKVPAGTAVLRSGGHAGDQLYVTGALGGSRLGKHLDFIPRIGVGQWLREHSFARAMIDVSDGLLTDLRHLMEASETGAHLELCNLPIAEAARDGASPREARTRALEDGEDFELLFAVPESVHLDFIAAWPTAFLELPISRMGHLTDDPGVLTYRDEAGESGCFEHKAFEHFRGARDE
jgi:thiamine-monophosphate kinase